MNFSVWKTIKLGGFKNVSDLKNALLQNGFKIGDWANDVMQSAEFSLARDEREVNLVRVSGRSLGFTEATHRDDVYARALIMGLSLCPLEVGPHLRLALLTQPHLESLQIGMEPQKDSEGHQSEFRVVHAHDCQLFLAGDHRHPSDIWCLDEEFVFVLP